MRMPDLESPVANPADIDVSPAEPKVPEAGQGQVSGGEGVPDWLRSFSLEDPTVPAPELEAPIAAEDTLVEEAPAESLAPVEAPTDDIPGWMRKLRGEDLAPLEEVSEAEAIDPGEAEMPAAAGSAEEAMEFPAMSFAARVKAAGGLVARAVKEVGGLGGLLEKVAEEQRIAAEMRQGLSGETGMETPELSGEELEILRKAHEVLVSHKSDSGMSRAEETLRANVLELQEQYKLGRKLAEEANEKYGAELKRAADELKPGWFEAEPAVVREMAELQVFFDQSGNEAELRRKIAEIEASQGNYMWTILTNKQKRQVEARLLEANTGLAALTSAERFMARTDMPKTLKAVIEVARAGRKFEFGTGPVAEFRREVYESIMGTLGVEAAPAPTPEPEPAPAAADEVETPMTEVPVEIEAAAETPEQRFEIRKQEFAGALAELDKAKGDTNGTEDEQKVRLAEAFNQVIGAAMEFMEEGDNAKEVVREFLSGALGTDGGKKLTEVAVRSRMDEVGVFQASTPEEKKKKLKEAGLWGLLTLLLELGMSFTDKAVKAVVSEVQSATGGGR